MGARKIGVTTLPPIGCLPTVLTLFGSGKNECVERLNRDAISFNRRLNNTSEMLKNKLSNLTLVVFDIYQPLYQLITKPAENGTSFWIGPFFMLSSFFHDDYLWAECLIQSF